jgi:hypothetical protein
MLLCWIAQQRQPQQQQAPPAPLAALLHVTPCWQLLGWRPPACLLLCCHSLLLPLLQTLLQVLLQMLLL